MRDPVNSLLTPAEQKIVLWLCLFFGIGTALNMAGWHPPVLAATHSDPESLAVAVQEDAKVIIDIRIAPASELEALPGIGAKRAADIVAYRVLHPFQNVNEIMNVRGIGVKTYAKMKPMLLVFGADAPLDKGSASGSSTDSAKADSSSKSSKASPAKKDTTAIVNINTASVAELCNLSGIGEVKAKAIVEYRTQNGKFTSIDDLANVKGIGPKTVEKNRARIKL